MRSAVVPNAIGTPSEGAAPELGDVRVTRVSEHGWRVSDVRRPAHDPLRLLAYVERRDDRFEVMQLGRGFELHDFDTLADAVAWVLRTAARCAAARRGL